MVNTGVIGHPMGPPLTLGLVSLGIFDSAIHYFVATMQGVVVEGVIAVLPSPSLVAPAGRVASLSLIHI